MNVLIAGSASQNVRQRPSCQIPEPGAEAWLELNQRLSEVWPNITQRRDPLGDADAMQDKTDKFKTYFTEAPGEGN